MQEAGPFGHGENVPGEVIVLAGLKVYMRLDRRRRAGLPGPARGAARREMAVLHDLVVPQIPVHDLRVASKLGHEEEADAGREVACRVGGESTAAGDRRL